MIFHGGLSSDERVLGAVADLCPLCQALGPKLITVRTKGIHLFSVTVADSITRAFASCPACRSTFPCELWHYQAFVPPMEAGSLSTEQLLDRTNVRLKERLDRERLLSRFAGDDSFEVAREAVERLRAGDLRKSLFDKLFRWGDLASGERRDLADRAESSARTLAFAESVAARVPAGAGCLPASLAAATIWSAFLWAPGVWKNLGMAVGIAFGGLVAGMALQQFLFTRRMRAWIDETLIPEGRKSGIEFGRFLDIVDDLPPPGPRNDDPLVRLKEKVEDIRDRFRGAGLVAPEKPAGVRMDE